ncbi:MAG: acylphosphatase [Betaproteobacteria bacterium]|nr:acylphosphatase [Betaproteobacteria bacterium]
MKITRRLRIFGRVQGVYFRESMRERAEQLEVTGWVRNCADGTVEAIAQGDAFAVGRLIEWAQRGPDAAQVDKVEVESMEEDVHYAIFDKKPSA